MELTLNEVSNIIVESGYKFDTLSKYGFEPFTPVKPANCSYVCIYSSPHPFYINRAEEIIVKRPYVSYAGRERKPLYSVPTLQLEIPQEPTEYKWIFIQPLVDVSDTARAYASEQLLDMHRFDIKQLKGDYHEYNLGLYKMQPVVFDW